MAIKLDGTPVLSDGDAKEQTKQEPDDKESDCEELPPLRIRSWFLNKHSVLYPGAGEDPKPPPDPSGADP